MIKPQVAGVRDIVGIYDVELKSYEYPLSRQLLTELFDTPGVIPAVVKYNGRVLAWGCGHVEDSMLTVYRLATLPSFRRTHNATRVLATLWDEAQNKNPSGVKIIVPEYQMLPDDPYSVNDFAWKAGFKATGIDKDAFYYYGRRYDGIILTRMV